MAIVKYIKTNGFQDVSFVCTFSLLDEENEDEILAKYISDILRGYTPDIE